MIVLSLLLLGLDVPDAAPAINAVKACDRDEIRLLIRGEPRRRTEFAAGVFAEQRAIASERGALLLQPAMTTPTGQASAAVALGQLESRQRQLDDARATERSWRDLFDEMRADYLANCTTGKRNAEDR